MKLSTVMNLNLNMSATSVAQARFYFAGQFFYAFFGEDNIKSLQRAVA